MLAPKSFGIGKIILLKRIEISIKFLKYICIYIYIYRYIVQPSNMSDMESSYKKLKNMYDGLSYFDQYGSSLLLCIIITIVLFILVSYCFALIYAQPIKDDWVNQRCNPSVIPFAGIINAPTGQSVTDFTKENFDYCTQNVVKGVTSNAVQPLTFVTSAIMTIFNKIQDGINKVREMFNKIRLQIRAVGEEIMGRLMNMMIPLQQIIIGMKTMLSRTQGILTAGLYTLMGSYYTLGSLMGSIAQMIVTILVALAAMIAAFWAVPFTWGLATANTAIFLAISIPMIIILSFMTSKLKVGSNLKIPHIKCFDEFTPIKMRDGETKSIREINVGDELWEADQVTAVFKVTTEGSRMYRLHNIIVSDSHLVQLQDKFIKVCDHPESIPLDNYTSPFLYCLNTTSKFIRINDHVFSDWDEIFESDLIKLKERITKEKPPRFCTKNIHEYLDGGFDETTEIELITGEKKKISDIKVNDILVGGEKVYGFVEIDGSNLKNTSVYNLGKGLQVHGGPNLNFYLNNRVTSTLEWHRDGINYTPSHQRLSKLYHLLTDKKTFYIHNVLFLDYNAAVDLIVQ